MLVLSRKKDEKIIIGDNITIMIVDIQGDKVRLGIDAPREVSVHREEVYQAIQKKQTEPAELTDPMNTLVGAASPDELVGNAPLTNESSPVEQVQWKGFGKHRRRR